jgi:hypothetical protein
LHHEPGVLHGGRAADAHGGPRHERAAAGFAGGAALTLLLAVALAALPLAASAAPAAPAGPLAQACAYLWAKQAADGGWHGETGVFRSGQALTPFILHALTSAARDACAPPLGAVERALGFLRRHVSPEGLLGVADPDVLEYPNYSTAYALRCFVRLGSPRDRPLIQKMRDRLAAEQYGPANGFKESSLAFGGWGFGGKHAPGTTGHMDLAHTRRVLEGLREAGNTTPALFERALVFLRLMQRDPSERRAHPVPLETRGSLAKAPRFDGGFFFSPIVLDANKGAVLADARGPYHGSYATATCDGLLALLAAGAPKDDARVRAAREWLMGHERLDQPEGIPRDTPQDWGQAVYYYHLAVRAEAYAALGLTQRVQGGIASQLAPRQRKDGSFKNERNHLMKEDDPLLATALAVIALGLSGA